MTLNVRCIEEGEDFKHLPSFDFTKLNAVNTCVRWGVISYGLHKAMSGNYRAMALEAGEACHQVFSALRIYDLYTYGPRVYAHEALFTEDQVRELACARLRELFSTERASEFVEITFNDDDDERTRLIHGGLMILETSGFYDDPTDKRRTIAKLSESLIEYVDRYPFGESVPLLARRARDVFVGVEQAFELVVEFDGHPCFRFTGRIDGVHCRGNKTTDPYIEENKTASKLGDAWIMSFDMSHQVTGYCIAAAATLGQPIDSFTRAKVLGLMIPQPRIKGMGYEEVIVRRGEHHLRQWSEWVRHTVETYNSFIDRPLDAPTYTGSCNRYFRPCSFIPLCASPRDEQEQILDEMVTSEWSPLTEKAGD